MSTWQQQELIRKLEDMVDSHGLDSVLDCLSTICFEKADHLHSNWQDTGGARLWDQAGKRVDSAAASPAVKAVS